MEAVGSAFLGQSKCEYLGDSPVQVFNEPVSVSQLNFEEEKDLALETLSHRRTSLLLQGEESLIGMKKWNITRITIPVGSVGALFLSTGGVLIAVGARDGFSNWFTIVGIWAMTIGSIIALWAVIHGVVVLGPTLRKIENFGSKEANDEIKLIDRQIAILNSPVTKSYFLESNNNNKLMVCYLFGQYMQTRITIQQQITENEKLVELFQKDLEDERDQDEIV